MSHVIKCNAFVCVSLAYHGVGVYKYLHFDLQLASAFIVKAIILLAFLNIRLISEHKDFFSSFTKFGKTLDKVCSQLGAAGNVVRLSPRARQRL